MALNFGCYMLIEISKFVHGKTVPAKMTVHIGFVNLSMAVTVKWGYFDQNFSNKFNYSYIPCSGCF